MKLKEIPEEERPRERLVRYGKENISNEDLIAIILKTGVYDKSAKDLSLEIIKKYKSVNNLKNISIEKLKSIKGVGEVKAITLMATIELGRRIFLTKSVKNNIKLNNSKDIWKYTKSLFYEKKQEYFYCLYLNNKQELITTKLLFIGTINRSVVHPREVFKEAYLHSASNIVCMHNHPSGDVRPSREDIFFTQNLMGIGKMQGIPVIDHIIVSENDYYSFYENKNKFKI